MADSHVAFNSQCQRAVRASHETHVCNWQNEGQEVGQVGCRIGLIEFRQTEDQNRRSQVDLQIK